MERLWAIDDLSQLQKTVKTYDQDRLYQTLKAEYFNRVEYQTAEEWNQLVRICEVFTIIGWRGLEPVNADCVANHGDAMWHTRLTTQFKEKRFLQGHWKRRKTGFVQFNPDYYRSPDRPEKPSISWEQYPKRAEIVSSVLQLADQRNKMKVSPLGIGGILYSIPPVIITSDMLKPFTNHLFLLFDHHLKPDVYGEGADNIIFFYTTPKSGKNDTDPSCWITGRYSSKMTTYTSEIFIGKDFVEMSNIERKILFKTLIMKSLNDLKIKMVKKKIPYKIDLLIADVAQIIDRWEPPQS